MTFWAIWKRHFLGQNYFGYCFGQLWGKLDHFFILTFGRTVWHELAFSKSHPNTHRLTFSLTRSHGELSRTCVARSCAS